MIFGTRANQTPHHTAAMTTATLTRHPDTLHVDGPRLWQRLMTLARIGATPRGGVCRLALSDLDRQGRELFMQWARDLGCTVNSIRAIVVSLTGTGEVAVHQRGKRSYVEAAP